MSYHDDLASLLTALREYEKSGKIPENPEQLKAIALRVLQRDPFEELALRWMFILNGDPDPLTEREPWRL